eukprot:COSAG01_NODE_29591_length_634_cov_0.826168_2_plen_125_part_01
MLGLGAAHFGDATTATVLEWLQSGGRAIDTSADYGHGMHEAERLTGVALRQTDVPREQIFLTTKVPQTELGARPPLPSSYIIPADAPCCCCLLEPPALTSYQPLPACLPAAAAQCGRPVVPAAAA